MINERMPVKKHFYFIAVFILLLFSVPLLAGCNLEKQLNAPLGLYVSDTFMASWVGVENSNGYTINLEGKEYLSETTNFQIPESEIETVGAYKIKVKANANTNGKYKDSNYCNEVVFYIVGQLDAPAGLQVDSSREILLWDLVPNALGYIVKIGETKFETKSNQFELAQVNFAGLFEIKVKAVGDNMPYADSDFSSISHKIVRKLAVPSVESIESINSLLRWKAIPNALEYEVEIDSESLTVSVNSINIYIEQLEETRTYKIKIKALGDGQYYLDSDFSPEYSYEQLDRLATPSTFSVNTNTRIASWTAVEGAQGYRFVINGPYDETSSIVFQTNFSLEHIYLVGEYYVKVSAIGMEGEKRDSKFTKEFDLVLGYDLSVPTGLSFNPANNELSWRSVSNADGYYIYAGGKDYYTETPFIRLDKVLAPGEHTVSVRAVSDKSIYFDSKYSSGLKCKVIITLSTPQNLAIDWEHNLIIWDSIPYTKYYSVYIYFESDYSIVSTYDASLSLSYIKISGDYVIKVRAIGNTNEYTNSSELSDGIEEYIIAMLSQPYSTSLNYQTKIYTFAAVENAVGYVVNIDGTDYFPKELFMDLSFLGSGTHTIKYKALGDGVNYRDSEYSRDSTFTFV